MRGWPLIGVLLLAVGGNAGADWDFAAPEIVGGDLPAGAFPHLEAAGRASIAVNADGSVALVWEDTRSGQARVYAAVRADADAAFGPAMALSDETREAAYEPAVMLWGDGRFLAAWEADGAVWGRLFGVGGPGPLIRLSKAGGRQPTLADGAAGRYGAWVRDEGGVGRVVVARLEMDGDRPQVAWRRPADPAPPKGQQLYPALAVAAAGPVVGWEDRRSGHTRVYYTRMAGDRFTPLMQLNELPPSQSARFGRGTGVTRVALAAQGNTVAASWMDKRQFQGGYDVYAAVSENGGAVFAANELVQDLFGDNQPQWHPDVAMSANGHIVTAWDDPRDGNPDIWLSWREGDGSWSGDFTFAAASGDGAQTHPVIAFGPDNRLHLAWIHRPESGTPSIRYSVGTWEE